MFFDNLQVTHTAGHILEETHYYPFGLVMAGISSRALNNIAPNNYKFNAGNELNESFGINLYKTFYRLQDVQTGRFLNTDPYAEKYFGLTPYNYAANNPVSINDPLGDQMKYPGDNGRMQKGPDGNYHAAWFSSFMWENKYSFNFGLSWGSSGGGSSGLVLNLWGRTAEDKDQRYSLKSETDKNGIEGFRISWWEDGTLDVVGHTLFISNGSNAGEQQQSSGGDGWDVANTIMGAAGVGLGAQEHLMEYAVRSSFKSARTYSEFNALRPTQQAWRYSRVLGNEGKAVLKGLKVGGNIMAGVSTAYSAVDAGSYYYNGGTDWQVGAKAGLDIIMTGVGFLGPIGFVVSSTYFILDASTNSFGGFGEH